MNYLDKVFNASYNKFLTAIDHVDYHPTSPDHDDNDPVLDYPTGAKRHAPNINVDTQRAVTLLKQLDGADLMLLTSILDKVFCMHPHLNNTPLTKVIWIDDLGFGMGSVCKFTKH